MGMYALTHGQNPLGPDLLFVIGLTVDDVGRYRDAYVSEGKIAVYTRNGGGNRECWEEEADDCHCTGCIATRHLPAHPLYSSDRDDDFDETYATFYFNIPDDWRERLAALDIGEFDPSARWTAVIAAIRGDS